MAGGETRIILGLLGFSIILLVYLNTRGEPLTHNKRAVIECLDSSLVCGPNAYCYNNSGNYSCSCWSGYNVTRMNESVNNSNPCTDVDECQLIPSVCGPNTICTNINGSYSCSCLEGYIAPYLNIGINNTCIDVDECQVNPSVCGPNSNCTNVNGGYNCSCLKGFNATSPNLKISINNTCTDVDECQLYPPVCGPNSICTNINGSYSCSCLEGFIAPYLNIGINNTCRDVDECQVNPFVCGPNSNCTNVNGSYNCSCLKGFNATFPHLKISINNTCTDVDECQLIPSVCGPNATCTNVNGSYSCSCMDGFNATLPYLPISINNTCTDVDECQLIPSVCGPNSNCTNVNGSYNCSCLRGFNATFPHLKISINNTCTDVDECQLIPSVCGPNSNCTNVNGSYNCSCFKGFNATLLNLPIGINNTCTDINKCLNSSLVCGSNAYCYNNGRNYSCSCWSGYNVTRKNEPVSSSNPCTDVDECQLYPSVCGPNSNCTNVNGGYNCSCLNGFNATLLNLPISIKNTCTNISKCLNSSLVCGPNAYCYNNYSCSCLSGYNVARKNELVSSSNPCTDVNECQLNPFVCGPNSNCTNVNGGYNCSCLHGFNATFPHLTIGINNTCTGLNGTAAPPTTTQSVIKMSMSMTIVQVFDTSLASDTEERRALLNIIQPMIDQSYKTVPDYIPGSAKVNNFRSGSIIVDYTITATSSSPDFTSANTQLANGLKQAGLPVDPNSFAESVPALLANTTNKIYPMQRLDLRCTRPASVAGAITWTVNKINPALDPMRYSIIESNTGSTLTVKNASESDSGRYSCTINRNTIPYIQWQDIVIEQRPRIEVDADRVFECKDQIVRIKCCAALYSIEWDRIPDGDQLGNSEPNCIILQHKLLKKNCGSVETFTCQLKDLKELQGYSYSRKSVTIQTSDKRIDCTNETLGIGQIGEQVNGLCDNGRIGFITYQCQSGGWRKIQIECVLPILASLQSEVQVLTEEKIPGFMASLSNATVQNSIEISQSASDVKAIVDMLLQITYISPNMTIDKTVMNTYLKTVDVIVSDQTNNTWAELNNGNTTSNTSTALLFAIEVTSNRLSDVNFALNESSIQLERTLIRNSFNSTSQQSNSTTQIMFSNVPEPTFVTLIFFSNLDNVLPTRNTSKNDTSTFENQINGDVVVIKVNQTVNNISLTFDITNEQLGNPQCVFWNFNLDRWDSNGCKVKHSGNGKVTCECNHTTSFSILMSPFFMNDKALAYITYIGVAISMASLVLCLIIEIIVWKSVTGNDTAYMRHVFVVNIAVSLLIADIWFIIGAAIAKPGESTPVNPCSAVVFFIHFFYLALFFWMLTSALLLLYRTAMVFSQMSRAKMIGIAITVGYCAPLLIAVITVASTAGAGRYIWTRDVCWLNWSESKALLAFVIPALTIVAFNLVVLIVVLYKIVRRNVNAATQTDEKHTLVVIVRCVAFLTPIFGLTWGFGVGTMVSNVYGLHVVFAILNSFQGFFVLVFGTLLDSKVRQSLAGKLKLKLNSDRTKSTTSTGPSSSVKLGCFGRMRRKHVYHVSDPNHFSRPSSNKTGVSSS
ncbi:uncharacterized protein [Paramisgurnus dabryanus]|uniref:uncharacterized protein isoform X2 n=1 Tax=Paramisgurnus dabryanus TaxID=90735 RepID=UPI003CCFA2A6